MLKWVLFTLSCLTLGGPTSSVSPSRYGGHRNFGQDVEASGIVGAEGATNVPSTPSTPSVLANAHGRRTRTQSRPTISPSTVQSLNTTSQEFAARSNLFVQLGQPRTGSTFQFTMVCAILRIKAYGAGGSDTPVMCDYVKSLLTDADSLNEHSHGIGKTASTSSTRLLACLRKLSPAR